jgi:hypothetical protein
MAALNGVKNSSSACLHMEGEIKRDPVAPCGAMSSFQVVAARLSALSYREENIGLQSATLIEADPGVEQSGSSNPIMYFGEVIALKAASLEASFESELNPSPHNIGTPAIPDGGEGAGVQSGCQLRVEEEGTM